MSNDDLSALVQALPADVRAAIEQQDEAAFQAAFNVLSEDEQLRVAGIFQQLQSQMAHNLLDQYAADEVPSPQELVASLPPAIAQAYLEEDPHALQAAYDALSPVDQENVGRIMMLLQAIAEQQANSPFSSNPADIVAAFDSLLEAIADAARDERLPRFEIELTLDELAEQGWMLREATRRIWAGEREAAALTAGLDEHDTALVERILEYLGQPA